MVDSEYTSDATANNLDLGDLGGSTLGDLGYTEGRQLSLELIELLEKISLWLVSELVCV